MFFGSVSGGLSAKLTSGNFWQGAATGLTVSALNHVAHKTLNNHVRIKIRTTNTNVENGTTDLTRPELELTAKIRRSGYVKKAYVKILNDNEILIDHTLSNDFSGDGWISDALNDSYNSSTNQYKLTYEGTTELLFEIPRIGQYLPKSYDWKFDFTFSVQNNFLNNSVIWDYNVNMRYSKWGWDLNRMGVESRGSLIFED